MTSDTQKSDIYPPIPFEGARRYRFRPRSLVVIEVLNALIVSGGIMLIALIGTPSPWNMLVIVVGVLVMAWAIRRSLRVGVYVDQSGITVQNYWRRHRLDWEDIAQVTLDWETIGPLPARAIAFRGYGTGRPIRAQASTIGEHNRRRLIRDLASFPEMERVHFDVPPELLGDAHR